MSQIIPHLMLIYGNYSITAEKTITGGIPKSWCDYSPEVTCGLHPHHISGVTIEVMQSRDTRLLCHHFGRINNGIQVITNHLFSCVLFSIIIHMAGIVGYSYKSA